MIKSSSRRRSVGRPRKSATSATITNSMTHSNFKVEPEAIIEQNNVNESDDDGNYEAIDDSFMDTHFGDSDNENDINDFTANDSIIEATPETSTTTFDDLQNSSGKRPIQFPQLTQPDSAKKRKVDKRNIAFKKTIEMQPLLNCCVKLEPIDIRNFGNLHIGNVESEINEESTPEIAPSISSQTLVEEPPLHDTVTNAANTANIANVSNVSNTSQSKQTVPPLTIRIKKEVMHPGYGDVFDADLAHNIKQEKSDVGYEIASQNLNKELTNSQAKTQKQKKLYKKPALLAIKIKQERIERETHDSYDATDDNYNEFSVPYIPDELVDNNGINQQPVDSPIALPIITQIHSSIDSGPSFSNHLHLLSRNNSSSDPDDQQKVSPPTVSIPFKPIRIKSEPLVDETPIETPVDDSHIETPPSEQPVLNGENSPKTKDSIDQSIINPNQDDKSNENVSCSNLEISVSEINSGSTNEFVSNIPPAISCTDGIENRNSNEDSSSMSPIEDKKTPNESNNQTEENSEAQLEALTTETEMPIENSESPLEDKIESTELNTACTENDNDLNENDIDNQEEVAMHPESKNSNTCDDLVWSDDSVPNAESIEQPLADMPDISFLPEQEPIQVQRKFTGTHENEFEENSLPNICEQQSVENENKIDNVDPPLLSNEESTSNDDILKQPIDESIDFDSTNVMLNVDDNSNGETEEKPENDINDDLDSLAAGIDNIVNASSEISNISAIDDIGELNAEDAAFNYIDELVQEVAETMAASSSENLTNISDSFENKLLSIDGGDSVANSGDGLQIDYNALIPNNAAVDLPSHCITNTQVSEQQQNIDGVDDIIQANSSTIKEQDQNATDDSINLLALPEIQFDYKDLLPNTSNIEPKTNETNYITDQQQPEIAPSTTDINQSIENSTESSDTPKKDPNLDDISDNSIDEFL